LVRFADQQEARMARDGWSAHFRDYLVEVMQEQGIKAKELATHLGVHANTIARWRNVQGTCWIPAASLVALSEYLGVCSAEWFLKCAVAPGVGKRLRIILRYMDSLDEPQLDHFLSIVERVINFAERQSAKVGEGLLTAAPLAPSTYASSSTPP
jgi:transcriptional regulator with XRE-family HTH domain